MCKLRVFINVVFVVVAAVVALSNPVWAQDTAVSADSACAPRTAREWADIGSFLDGVMTAHLESHGIAGAALVVTEGETMVYARGFGFSDLEAGDLVDPHSTLFRTGSTGKVITWTAVMQLVESGLLDLQTDVNEYLRDFAIPATYPEPITLAHLMAHTAGFEERIIGIAVRDVDDLTEMGRYLAENMPARVRPPGQISAYSNYGAALAGHIVAEVSGIPFEEYVETRVFDPLGMDRSTFRQPLPEDLSRDMSAGYSFSNGWFEEEDFELFSGMAPAGTMTSTAVDMARFAMALLQGGQGVNGRILTSETSARMLRRTSVNHPDVCGNAHGFWERRIDGVRILEHAGDTLFFHGLLAMIPDESIGVYVCYNSFAKGRLPRVDLIETLANRLRPEIQQRPSANPNFPDGSLDRFEGVYGSTRSVESTFVKVTNLLSTTAVRAAGSDRLSTGTRQWARTGPLSFTELGGQGGLVFVENGNGDITHFLRRNVPEWGYVRLPWYESPAFNGTVVGVCVVLFLSAIAWPLSPFTNPVARRLGRMVRPIDPTRLVTGILCWANLLFLVGLGSVFADTDLLIYGDSTFLRGVLAVPMLTGALTLASIATLVTEWRRRRGDRGRLIRPALVVIASVVFHFFLSYWNLL